MMKVTSNSVVGLNRQSGVQNAYQIPHLLADLLADCTETSEIIEVNSMIFSAGNHALGDSNLRKSRFILVLSDKLSGIIKYASKEIIIV